MSYSCVNYIPDIFSVTDILKLTKDYFETSFKALGNEFINLLQRFVKFEDLLAYLRHQFYINFRSNLADVICKKKLINHFLRVLPLNF